MMEIIRTILLYFPTMMIPRCMSTQHPDNAYLPQFAEGPALEGHSEIEEAYYAFSRLGCDEQMWDHEGKEVDSFVVSKLLTEYGTFFKENRLGKDLRLTLRVPNPSRERGMSKVLLEILESIPRSYDIARAFYDGGVPPIFEVILPMTTSAIELNRIWHYYYSFISGKADEYVIPGDIKLREWIGDFLPRAVGVIPLIEDKESMLKADSIVEEYVRDKKVDYQRVFLARSDPAMTYGSTSAVLLLKITLRRLHELEKRLGLPLYPIVGLGSAPFRGNFKPTTVRSRITSYSSVQTFTIQSAFKFDYPEELVRSAIEDLKSRKRSEPVPIEDEARVLQIVDKISATYARQVTKLAPLINSVAKYVPSRRKRRLHVGLFGYARSVSGVHLPRAISFCAAFYSLGVPPELLGLSDLTTEDLEIIRKNYPNFDSDLTDALFYLDRDAFDYLPKAIASDLKKTLKKLKIDVEPNLIHRALVKAIRKQLPNAVSHELTELIAQAARERRFLG
jgi:phosphoenolpyruvate carboxylase